MNRIMSGITARSVGLVAAVSLAAVTFVATAGSASAGLDEEGCPIIIEVDVFRTLSVQELDVCEITVEKTLTSTNPVQVGNNVTFEVTVENTGNVNLTNVALSDSYDQAHLDFLSANPAPSDVDESVGILDWQDLAPSPDGGSAGVWEPGESRTVTVTFRALAVDGAENCGVAVADVPAYQSEIGSEFDCADVRIIPGSGGRSEPTNTPVTQATPTTVPSSPTPVVSVAPATVVPPTPRPVGVTAPDTGDGSGETGNAWLIAIVVAGGLLLTGAMAIGTARRRSS